MDQIRHMLSAILIIITVVVIYSVGKPIATTTWIIASSEEIPTCGNVNMPEPLSLNKQGKILFQQNCQTCHSIFKSLTGPALAGFEERGPWNNRKELYKWIKNPEAYIQNDTYTKTLQAQYGTVMQAFPQLTKSEIDSIADYISTASAAPIIVSY